MFRPLPVRGKSRKNEQPTPGPADVVRTTLVALYRDHDRVVAVRDRHRSNRGRERGKKNPEKKKNDNLNVYLSAERCGTLVVGLAQCSRVVSGVKYKQYFNIKIKCVILV